MILGDVVACDLGQIVVGLVVALVEFDERFGTVARLVEGRLQSDVVRGRQEVLGPEVRSLGLLAVADVIQRLRPI